MSATDIYRPKLDANVKHYPIRGFDYEVLEWGDADRPMFVWLHGWGDCARTFQFVVDELSRDWFVVAPDLRGFGGSRGSVASYWFPDYLADLDRLLEIYSPDAPVALVGHSMGANIAGLFAGVMPDRVRALINVEGFGLSDSNPADAPYRYRDWIEKGRAESRFSRFTSYAALAERVRKRSPALSAARAEFVARCWAAESDGEVVLRADPLHRLPNAVLYRRAEAEACWRQVTAPVLILAGRDSEFLEARDPRLDASPLPFPDSTTRIIDDSGHMLHFEVPGALAAEIERFLDPDL